MAERKECGAQEKRERTGSVMVLFARGKKRRQQNSRQ